MFKKHKILILTLAFMVCQCQGSLSSTSISKVTTRKNGGWWQNGASLNGGTLVWISGNGFAENLFSFSPTTDTSNAIQMVSLDGISSYPCELHTDKVTSTLVTCYTTAMPAGTYMPRIQVNGDFIPLSNYASFSYSQIVVSSSNTPMINTITPSSGLPGTFLKIQGDFKTSCYTRDVIGCGDDAGSRITRVYFGGQICDLMDASTNALYGNLTQYEMYCKLGGAYVGLFNASILVDQDNGRSLTQGSNYLVTADEQIYTFLTYAEISNVSTNTGSLNGGTILTIFGQYFFSNPNLTAIIDIGGTQCNIVDFKLNNKVDSMLVCETSPKPNETTDFYGGRGMTVYVDKVYTSSLSSATPSTDATVYQLDSASYTGNGTSAQTIWMKGFFTPARSSSYSFNIQTNGQALLYLSSDATSANKAILNQNSSIDLIGGTL